MRPHLPSLAALAAAATTMSAASSPALAAGPAPARHGYSALTLSPTASHGVAAARRVLGPFSLRNDTTVAYDVTVDAVLLAQRRSGAIVVRDDPGSRRAAALLLGLQTRHFSLASGRVQSVSAVVRAVGAERGIYAGLLFSARPRTHHAAGAAITNVLRLDAGQLLAPRDPRPRFAFQRIRAEQAGPRRLRLELPVQNDGNVLGRVGGQLDILDAEGRRVLRAPIGDTQILPGATVDVPALLGGRLGPGRYTIRARIVINGRPRQVAGTMELFGINTVRAQDARLTGLESPKATQGSPVAIDGAFRNTGNVPYAPDATVEIRAIDEHGAPSAAHAPRALKVERVGPGRNGRITGSVALPQGRAFQLTVRLMAGARELDEQAVRVDVHDRPTLGARLQDFLRTNAVIIIAAAFALLLAGAAFSIRYVARLRARLASASAS